LKTYYQEKEEKAHFWTHFVGVIFILVGGPILLSQDVDSLSLRIGIIIYVISFLGVFGASSLYHFNRNPNLKAKLRAADHIAIYLFIVGTNAPLLLGFADHNIRWFFLGFMYALALIGIIFKLRKIKNRNWISLAFYLLMGWLGIYTIYLVYPKLHLFTFIMVAVGGLLYSIGTYFYRNDQKIWFHTIWHIFVLLAAVAHFSALAWQIYS
jgi:hemolysin III